MVNVCVVGLGKVGLPLAVQYASRGLTVSGCDTDADRVAQVNAGVCPIAGEAGLEEGLAAALAGGTLRATADTAAAVAACDVAVIIVPVGLTGGQTPDFTNLDAAVESIRQGLRPGTLVVVETTVPVGTTRGRAGAALAGVADVRLAASPERLTTGRIFQDLRSYPKIVGAIDDASWAQAEAFYKVALEAPAIMRVANPETAELAKLAEGVYRDVNIALAGELARYADAVGVDVAEVIRAANSQPYAHLHQPGVGVGGHCLPVYPHFLPREAQLALPAAARAVNDAMAAYGVQRLEQALGSLRDTTVLVLGVSYRANVKEAAHSSALLLVEALQERGAKALVHDPLFTRDELRGLDLAPVASLPHPGVDAIIVQAWHDEYRDLDFTSFAGCRAVLDGRNVLTRSAIEAAGMRYVGIGR